MKPAIDELLLIFTLLQRLMLLEILLTVGVRRAESQYALCNSIVSIVLIDDRLRDGNDG